MRRSLPWLSLLVVGACLTHISPRQHDRFDRITWAASYDEALAQATAEQKPILVVMVAGPRAGAC